MTVRNEEEMCNFEKVVVFHTDRADPVDPGNNYQMTGEIHKITSVLGDILAFREHSDPLNTVNGKISLWKEEKTKRRSLERDWPGISDNYPPTTPGKKVSHCDERVILSGYYSFGRGDMGMGHGKPQLFYNEI